MLEREVYEQGQVVIPKHIRDMLGIKPKTKVSFSIEGDKIIIKKSESVMKWFEELANTINYNQDIDSDKLYDEENDKYDLLVKIIAESKDGSKMSGYILDFLINYFPEVDIKRYRDENGDYRIDIDNSEYIYEDIEDLSIKLTRNINNRVKIPFIFITLIF